MYPMHVINAKGTLLIPHTKEKTKQINVNNKIFNVSDNPIASINMPYNLKSPALHGII